MAWNKVAVVGAALINFGELFEQSYEHLAAGAFQAACGAVDKGFDPTQIEAAFRTLKSDLGVRPIYHRREHRVEAHIFIAFLAYCLQVTLKNQLMLHAP